MNARRLTLPMRSLLLIAVVHLATVPPLLGVVVWLAMGHVQHATEDRAVVAAERYLSAGSGRWETSGWQQEATVYFRSLDVEVAETATPETGTTPDTGKPVTATVFATPGLAACGANKAGLGTTMDAIGCTCQAQRGGRSPPLSLPVTRIPRLGCSALPSQPLAG